MSTDEKYAVIDRLFNAIPAGDLDAIREVYHPDVQVWHSNTDSSQGYDENIGVLQWIGQALKDVRYEDISRIPMDSGKVHQRHVLKATTGKGREIEVHACMVFTFSDDGRLLRLEEYLDSTQIAPIAEDVGLSA